MTETLRTRVGWRRSRRRLIAGLAAVVAVVATIGAVAITRGRTSDDVVALRTTGTAPPVTVPAGTTVADLRFTPIAGPAGGTPVGLHAVGDRVVALADYPTLTRAWMSDEVGRWRKVALPRGVLGSQGDVVIEQLRTRVVVIAHGKQGQPVVFEGATLDHLRESRWTSPGLVLPAAIHPAPPPGRAITVIGSVDTTAVGEAGIVMAGRALAQLNPDLLPRSVRDRLAHHPGRIDVRDGRVVATGSSSIFFDRSARAMGLTTAEIAYLSRSDDSRTEIAVWGAAWGKPIRQLSAAGIDTGQRFGNLGLAPVSDGFVLSAPTAVAAEMWWSRDGRSWRHLAAPPHEVMGLIDLGSRWVVPSAGVVSDDKGRSWTAIDLTGDVAHHPGASPLLGMSGTSAFGLLGASTPLDASTVTTFAGRLLYSPDGTHWSSVALDEALGFSANIPSIAVGERYAILESGLRVPGAQPQRFWLVTRR